MKKLILTVELTYDDQTMYGGDNDIEAKRWFYDILRDDTHTLFSEEIGDDLGTVKVIGITTRDGEGLGVDWV